MSERSQKSEKSERSGRTPAGGQAERRRFHARFRQALAEQGIASWPLPCGCVGFRCPCCGEEAASLGQDALCHYGNAGDGRHRWLVREYAPR